MAKGKYGVGTLMLEASETVQNRATELNILTALVIKLTHNSNTIGRTVKRAEIWDSEIIAKLIFDLVLCMDILPYIRLHYLKAHDQKAPDHRLKGQKCLTRVHKRVGNFELKSL